MRLHVAVLTAMTLMAGPAAAQASRPDFAPVQCKAFGAKLKSCTPYTCVYPYPFNNAPVSKQIIGPSSGGCATIEQTSDGGIHIACRYTPATQAAVANYLVAVEAAIAANKKIEVKGDKTFINGVSIGNPAQDAVTRGECQ